MSYDENLAVRIRGQFDGLKGVEEKRMFGGLCFMLSHHMCCGIVKDTLMARVGPDNYQKCLARKYASEMDFTGRALKGMVYVAPTGIKSNSQLAGWLNLCIAFVQSLPAKKLK